MALLDKYSNLDAVDKVAQIDVDVDENVEHVDAFRVLNRHEAAVAVMNKQVTA